jgi:hypothetical protein
LCEEEEEEEPWIVETKHGETHKKRAEMFVFKRVVEEESTETGRAITCTLMVGKRRPSVSVRRQTASERK